MGKKLTTGQVSQLYGVHVQTVRNWTDSGKLPYRRTPGKHRLIDRDDLERLLSVKKPTKTY